MKREDEEVARIRTSVPAPPVAMFHEGVCWCGGPVEGITEHNLCGAIRLVLIPSLQPLFQMFSGSAPAPVGFVG